MRLIHPGEILTNLQASYELKQPEREVGNIINEIQPLAAYQPAP